MSIGSNIGRGLVALGVLAAVSSTAHADRRTGYAGNLLIEDKDDVYFFPHLTSTYRNLVSLDYGGAYESGNALLTLGNADMAYGVALHRGDVLTPQLTARNTEIGYLGGVPANFPNPPFADDAGLPLAPATVIDLLMSFGDIGFRAAIGRGLNTTVDGMGDASGSENTYLMGEFGWGNGGVRGESTRLDISGAISANFGSAYAAGEDTVSGTRIGLDGLLRAYLPQDEQLDLGILGRLSVSSLSVTNEAADPAPSDSVLDIGLGAGVGPAFRFGAAQVAAYATLRLGYNADEPNSEVDDDETNSLSVVIPGVNIATEIPLNDWFVVRTGAQYDWNLVDRSGPGPDDEGSGDQTGTFGWNAGVGVIVDQFRFDGSLQQGFLLSGPNFIGGNTAGFFAIAALTYSFDTARSGEVTPTGEPEATEPVPVPEPPPPALQPAPPPGDVPAPAPAPGATENPETGATGGAVGGTAGGSISIGGGTR
jgi:hypothetical protein